MASDYWKTSPFGENSIFHPSWEEKEKERRRSALPASTRPWQRGKSKMARPC